MRLLFLLLFASLVCSLSAKRLQPESVYQDYFAAKVGGETEVTCDDGTRCDIVTGTHAIEVDFADKWGEAIGQSLNYGFQLNKKAGILLILEKESDYKYFVRINSIIQHHGLEIDVWKVEAYKGEGVMKEQIRNPLKEVDSYWISSTGKTHNSSCRYYRNSKGHASDRPSGNNCKICGGSK